MNSPAVEQALGSGSTSIAGDSLRLNLGGRDTRIPGFKTIDKKPGPNVDFVWDISDLSLFGDNSVDEIYASHCLEHFPHVRTLYVLEEWHRVLKNGASCHISVPDFDAVAKLYQKTGLFSDYLRNLLWGDQEYDLAFHYAGFTFASLSALLIKAGFEDVKRRTWMPYDIKDCSQNLDNVTFKPISLTVEAIA